jgi:PAS domain S-box-containing protein
MSAETGDIYTETLSVFADAAPVEPLTTPEVAQELAVGRRTVYKRLRTLVERGQLSSKKVGSGGRVWWQPPERTAQGTVSGEHAPTAEPERLNRIIDAVGDPVYELDEAGRFTYVNDSAVALSGYSRDELLGSSVTLGMDRETVARVESIVTDLLGDETRDSATVEYEITTKSGETVPVENHLMLLTDHEGRFRGTAGVLRDISGRKARQSELERTAQLLRHTERLADIGGWELDVTEPPYEATWTEQLFDIFGFEQRETVLPAEVLSAVHPDDHDRVAAETDQLLNGGGGLVQEYRIVTVDEDEKWIRTVSDPADDESGVIRGATMDVTTQKKRERELEGQRARLRALNDLNEVVRGITEAVIEQSTREGIERITCERLTAADSYVFAWAAEVDPETQAIRPRVEVGTDGYLDDIELSADPDHPTGQGPAGRAIRTGEMCVARDARTDPSFEPWQQAAHEYGYRSAAAVPIVHDGVVYGVVGVYSNAENAFNEAEQEIIGQIGEVAGHAIAAIERKQALDEGEITEISFQVRDPFDRYGFDLPGGEIRIDRTVHVEGDTFLAYGTTGEAGLETVRTLAERDEISRWESASVLFGDDDEIRFEARWNDPTVLGTIADAGGYVREAVLTDSAFRMRVELTTETDVQSLVDSVTAAYPTVELLARRRKTRPELTAGPLNVDLSAELTERQATVLKTGYFSGFFDSPRRSSGEAVAETLGISPSTYHQHLRKAQKRLLDLVFETD